MTATIHQVLAEYGITQDWPTHLAKAGAHLGGVDWATPHGTVLPPPAGTVRVEYVTPATKNKPAWYNAGLGNAVAWVRADGTRTIYAHGSRYQDGAFYSGNSGTVRPAPTKTNPHAGSHVHIHDVLKDGKTRARPFSTLTATAGGGFAPFPTERNDDMPTIYWDGQDYNKRPNPAWFAVVDGGRVITTQDAALISRMEAAWGVKRVDLGSSARFNDWVAILTRPLSVTGGNSGGVADPGVLAELKTLTAAVRALPKEIDEYADGKKQS